MPVKPWYHSWTVWFNVASVLIIIAGYIADNALRLGLPPQWGEYAAGVVAIGNAVIRLLRTSQPLSTNLNADESASASPRVRVDQPPAPQVQDPGAH